MKMFIQRLITGTFLALAGACIWIFTPAWTVSVLLLAIVGYILIFEWPKFKVWWLTPIYPIFPFLLLILLNQMNIRILLLLLCVITFAHDTGAYIGGNLFGRHRILPTVSPGKTWEGFWTGYGISLVIAMFFVYYTDIKIKFWGLPMYVLMLNAAALAGDLFESYLKRRVGLKDSGKILPGHGGLLDRFDGLLFAVVVFYLIILL